MRHFNKDPGLISDPRPVIDGDGRGAVVVATRVPRKQPGYDPRTGKRHVPEPR